MTYTEHLKQLAKFYKKKGDKTQQEAIKKTLRLLKNDKNL